MCEFYLPNKCALQPLHHRNAALVAWFAAHLGDALSTPPHRYPLPLAKPLLCLERVRRSPYLHQALRLRALIGGCWYRAKSPHLGFGEFFPPPAAPYRALLAS